MLHLLNYLVKIVIWLRAKWKDALNHVKEHVPEPNVDFL